MELFFYSRLAFMLLRTVSRMMVSLMGTELWAIETGQGVCDAQKTHFFYCAKFGISSWKEKLKPYTNIHSSAGSKNNSIKTPHVSLSSANIRSLLSSQCKPKGTEGCQVFCLLFNTNQKNMHNSSRCPAQQEPARAAQILSKGAIGEFRICCLRIFSFNKQLELEPAKLTQMIRRAAAELHQWWLRCRLLEQ